MKNMIMQSKYVSISKKSEFLEDLENNNFKSDDLKKYVLEFKYYLSKLYDYLMKYGNFLDLRDGTLYDWLNRNIGVLIFLDDDYRARDIIRQLRLEKRREFPLFDIDDKYICKLKELVMFLDENGFLPVQTDRYKFSGGTYMGRFIAHNKRKFYMLKEGCLYAYRICRYYEQKELKFTDKLNEVYAYLFENDSLPFIDDTTVRFSNGEVMSYFLSHNRAKLSEMDDDRARAIIECLDGRKKVSFDEKIVQLYAFLLKGNLDGAVFSDGVNVQGWLRWNKRLIYEADGFILDLVKEKLLELNPNYFEYFENRQKGI